MLLFFPWKFWNGHFCQAKSEENKQVTHRTVLAWEENVLSIFGCSFPHPFKAANYTLLYNLCCDVKEILDIVAQKRLGLKWPLPVPLCLQHFKASRGKACWVLFSLVFSRQLKHYFEGEDGQNDTQNPILGCPLVPWNVWSEQCLDSPTARASRLSEAWPGSHLACSWVPQIICWAQASQQADSNAAEGTGFPNGRAQIKILFRNYSKWRLSGTGNLCGADGERRGHLGECDTDTWPASCF